MTDSCSNNSSSNNNTPSSEKFVFVNDKLTNTLPAILPDYLTLILTAKVYEVAKESPLQLAPLASEKLNRQVYLKREDMQSVFSFKLRGAYNRMQQLTPNEQKCGVIACSAGNHAQGVALSAKKMNINATIVMPNCTPAIKVNSVRKLGGNVVLHGSDFDEARKESRRRARQHGMIEIPPFDDPFVIAGQGTIATEIFRQTDPNKIAAIFVCVGGGGLLAGIAAYTKRVFPFIKVIGVEAADAAGMTRSIQAGKIVSLDTVGLFAEGAAVRDIGHETFRVAKGLVDGMVNVTTDEVCAAIKDVFEDTRTIVEPAGALALAGCKKYVHHITSGEDDVLGIGNTGSLIVTCSGANMNFDRLRFVAERADIGEEKEALVSVVIPEVSGEFVKLYRCIHPRKCTEFIYRFEDAKKARILLGFRVRDGVSREEDLDKVIKTMTEQNMKCRDWSHNEMVKAHARFFSGSKTKLENERIIRFRFPERDGELNNFVNTYDSKAPKLGWNITLLHYRNYGGDIGDVMFGIQVPPSTLPQFQTFLEDLKYHYVDETDNEAYKDIEYE